MFLKTALHLHASSSDLKFLNPVTNRIFKILGDRVKVFELANQSTNAEAALALKLAESGFVSIFAHGTDDYLRGGEYRSRTSGENVEIEKFLTRQDLGLFKGKVVFCMSCDSNALAELSLASGARAFVGFDEIPFDRFDENGDPIGSHVLVKHCQELIAESIQATLERFLLKRASLEECVNYLRLWIASKAINYVREMGPKGVKERKEIAALFLKVKAGVKYHGYRPVYFATNG